MEYDVVSDTREDVLDELEEEPRRALEASFGRAGDFELVGNGSVTNRFCGTYTKKFKGCIRVELHNRMTLDGVSYAGKVYVKPVHNFCYKPSCPICFKHGWAVREAGNVEERLAEASKRFGRVEHIVCSVPSADYGLSYETLHDKVLKVLFGCGVIGGVVIFHAFRYDLGKLWYFSPHFHVLGFILGGYGRCRHCKGGDCYSCSGFEGKVYRAYRGNGYIVKVFDERKTVGGTAWYQLNHASLKIGVKFFRIATWFGVCSYRKLKVTVERRKALCPICQHELELLRYFGGKDFVVDRSSPDFKREFFADYMEDGRPVWFVFEDAG